jgi:hypothetical protein
MTCARRVGRHVWRRHATRQSPGSVSIYYDVGQGSGYSWVVPITNRPHLPKNVQLYRGDPIGRWEGDTLVVDVTNFSDETNFHGSRENLHIVERFKRSMPAPCPFSSRPRIRRRGPAVDVDAGAREG